jgi:ABC-type uncharacterized transport system permease subunit
VVLSHDGFCFFQCGGPPLNLKIFISSNAFDNSSFFYEQPEFTWLVRVVIAVKTGGEINAASRYPIPLYDALIRAFFPFFQLFKFVIFISALAISPSDPITARG